MGNDGRRAVGMGASTVHPQVSWNPLEIFHVQAKVRVPGSRALPLKGAQSAPWSACVSCSVMSDSLRPVDSSHQAPLSMGFSRREYWSGLPFPSPGDLPESGIEPGFPVLQADSLPSEPPGKTSWGIIASPIHRLLSVLNPRKGPFLSWHTKDYFLTHFFDGFRFSQKTGNPLITDYCRSPHPLCKKPWSQENTLKGDAFLAGKWC